MITVNEHGIKIVNGQLDSPNPKDHLRNGCTVVAWWKVDQAGYLTLAASRTGEFIDIYDTKLGDAEPTDTVTCWTCGDVELDVTDDVP